MKFSGLFAGNLILILSIVSSYGADDKKWRWDDNRRSNDDSGSNQNAASAGQIKLKLDDSLNSNNRYSQKPQGDSPSSDDPYEFNENEDDDNRDKDYFRPRPNYDQQYYPGANIYPSQQGGRYPVDAQNYPNGGRYPGQGGGRYPFDGNRFPQGGGQYPIGQYQPNGGRFPPNRYPNNNGYDANRFSPGNPSQFSHNNIPFRPSRPFTPGVGGPYQGPWEGNNRNPGRCSCVPRFSCPAPGPNGGQCAPGKSLCCHDGFGGPGGPIGPGAPIRRPQYHSIANGILAGPGGPVDPIPGQSRNSIVSGPNINRTINPNNIIITTPPPRYAHSNPNPGQSYSRAEGAAPNNALRPTAYGQTNGQDDSGAGRFYYRIVRGPIYNKPRPTTYRTIDQSAIQSPPAMQHNTGGMNAFRLFLSFMSKYGKYSAATAVLAGPGGPVDTVQPQNSLRLPILQGLLLYGLYGYGIPGGNFIPEIFNRPFGGPYGSGPAGPYGNAYDNYARKAS